MVAPQKAPRRNARRSAPRAPAEASADRSIDAVAEASAPSRAAMRAPVRDEDSRARASRRAAELRDHLGDLDEGVDKFYVDHADIPDGWEYEWKRVTVLGKEDPAYMVQTARKGWEPVPASRHPSYMPATGGHATIERDGMILMERPKEISQEARAIELKKARQQVRQKEQQLTAAPDGQFDRQKPDGSSLVKVGKTFEHIAIPE